MPDAPVLLAGRYRLGESLGRGGMGQVRLARDETLQRDVAIKEIDQPLGTDREAAARRTLREARAAARIGHPSVVQVYDVLQLDDRTWIVMEYVPSRSLREEIAEQGPLDHYRVARIGLDLLGALRTAHRLGVEHRDVKPANVLLADDGRVLLTDFGIAAVDDDAVISRSDILVGSPQFMAPERAQGKPSGPEADLWSLGATLYAAVEGHAPYQRGSTMATLAALATEPPEPPVNAGPLRPLLDGLLVKDPGGRMHAEDAESLAREVLATLTAEAELPAPRKPGGFAGLAASIPAALRIPRPRAASGPSESPGSGSGASGPSASGPSASGPSASGPSASGPSVSDPPVSDPPAADSQGVVGATEPGEISADTGAPQAGHESRDGADAEAAARNHAVAAEDGEGTAAAEVSRATGPGEEGAQAVTAQERDAADRLTPDVPPDDLARQPVTVAAGVVAGQRRPNHRSLLAAAAALAVLVIAGAAWALSGDPDAPVAKPQAASPATAGPAGPAVTSAAPSADAALPPQASPSGTPGAGPSAATGDAGRPPLPDGWREYRDPSGFSVYVPVGWTRSQSGSIVYFRKDGKILGIDQTDKPRPNPVKDWQNQARNRVAGGDFTNYQEVGIKAVDYFRKAADWEFLHTRDGVRKHVNNRGTVVADDKAYGFYWETPESEWAASRADLQLIFDSFQPAR